jgi:hypothetical protein
MAFFFRPYPTISYRIPGTKKSIPVTDITRRFAVSDFIRNAKVTFDEYHIQDGERPDIVANDYYDDPTLDWLILLTNEIQDPYYEWPLSYEQFNAYLKQKYGTIEYTLNTTHHYEKIIQKNSTGSDGIQQRIYPEKTLEVDYTTFAALPFTDRKEVTILEYEQDLNEQRRHIYLLDLHYVHLIKDQHPYIFEESQFIR